MNRREFVRWCQSAGLGVAFPLGWQGHTLARQREPAPYEGPFFVVVNAAGGWDTTYLMDPKGVGGINRLYREGDIQTQGAIRFAPTAKHAVGGMANETFFAKYARELLVLNGLDYSVNNHDPCSRYMATGKLDSLAYPTFAALVAACKGAEYPLAFLTFGNYSSTGNLVPMARIPYLNSLHLLANADGVQGSPRHPYHDAFVLERIEKALADKHQAIQSSPRLPRTERAQNMLYAAQENSKILKRVVPFIPKTIPRERLSVQAEVALAAFKGGVAVSANLTIGQFDSHANNDAEQMKLIPELLAGIDYLLRRAEELQIREKLVVIAQSEMGRTPHYNSGQGKDHWSVGSAMFLGPNLRGNRVIGATDQKQFLIPIDAKTLRLDAKNGMRIRPEHVHAALRRYAGIEHHPFAKQFPLDIPATEQLPTLWMG